MKLRLSKKQAEQDWRWAVKYEKVDLDEMVRKANMCRCGHVKSQHSNIGWCRFCFVTPCLRWRHQP